MFTSEVCISFVLNAYIRYSIEDVNLRYRIRQHIDTKTCMQITNT